MRAKHTPGPWAVLVGHDGSISVAADGPRRINLTTAGTPVIADVCRHADAEHFSGEANARLIAAAPDLLEALLSVLDNCTDSEGLAAAHAKARAAITKATGGQA